MNTILLITANQELMTSAGAILQKLGFKSVQATTSQEAQEKITSEKPSLIVLDDTTLGNENAAFFAALQTNITIGYVPVLVVSSTDDGATIQNYIQLGATDVVHLNELTEEQFGAKIQKSLTLSGGAFAGGDGGMVQGAQQSAPAVNPGSTKILIIEDDQFLNELSQTKLTKVGYQVISALDGETGLAKALEEKPDIILLDILLPGIDGFEVLRQIKSSQDQKINKIPVILLSNFGQEEKIQQGMALGAKDYLVKANFTTNEIVTKIQKTLEETQNSK